MSVNQQHYLPSFKIIFSSLLLMIIIAAYFLHQNWDSWLQYSVVWQRSLNRSLTELLQATSTDPWQAGILLMGSSFLYGLLHAIGPGHGKLIITTYIATQPARLKQSVILSLLASLLQGLVAIILVSTILIVFQLSTRHLNSVSLYSEKISYGFVILLGVLCCIKACQQLWKIKRKPRVAKPTLLSMKPLNSTESMILQRKSHLEINCGCGHQHVVSSHHFPTSLRSQALIVLSMGLRPCSGALLVLLFSYVIGVYQWGILAAMAMAVGTALTICSIAFVVYFLRDLALRLTTKQQATLSPYWGIILNLCAGVIFILLGILMFQSLMITEMRSPLFSPRIH